jgi:hypothetical protein
MTFIWLNIWGGAIFVYGWMLADSPNTCSSNKIQCLNNLDYLLLVPPIIVGIISFFKSKKSIKITVFYVTIALIILIIEYFLFTHTYS